MNWLAEIPNPQPYQANLKVFKRDTLSCFIAESIQNEDVEILKNYQEDHVMVFIPIEKLVMREKKVQDWTINLPKGKGQETLYSTTFFWTAADEHTRALMDIASEREWAIYTISEDKICLLVEETGIAFDIDGAKLLEQIKGD